MYKIIFSVVLVVLVAVYLKNFEGSFFSIFKFTQSQSKRTNLELFTEEDLKTFNGIDKPLLYLSMLGNVYDVTRGKKHYGPGETYNFFVGRDGTRSFVTGEFKEGVGSDDVKGFSNEELKSLDYWKTFYNKEYGKVGLLKGRYYDSEGEPTPYGKEVKKLIKQALDEQTNEDNLKVKFPPCNVEWDMDQGTRVWCTDKSGGVQRDWIGYPRQMYEQGSKEYRCACVSEVDKYLGNVKEYTDCDTNAQSCYVKE